jgi:hypothetical protein
VVPPFVALGPGEDYVLEHADGDVEGAGGVLLVVFDPPEEWAALRALLAPRQGYLGSRLFRGGERRVALVRWSSPLMHARALRDPEIGAAAEGLDAALYLPL